MNIFHISSDISEAFAALVTHLWLLSSSALIQLPLKCYPQDTSIPNISKVFHTITTDKIIKAIKLFSSRSY